MMIRFSCLCGKKFTVPGKFAGSKVKCQACGQALVVPVPEPAETGEELPRPPGETDGLRCPICQWPIESGEAQTLCPGCRTEYHQECWQMNGGCAVYGCKYVPPTEHLEDIEIPVSYWGQEYKPCPACRAMVG